MLATFIASHGGGFAAWKTAGGAVERTERPGGVILIGVERARDPALALKLADVAQIHENDLIILMQRDRLRRRDGFDLAFSGLNQRSHVRGYVLRHVTHA
jgi:hypothetical protein